MRLTCPGCNAKYTIRSERLDGRRAKVRCKRCGESFSVGPAPDLFAGIATAGAEEAEAESATTASKPMTGERNESSVLFSLAMMAKDLAAPPPAGVNESSALIDLRALCSVSSNETARAPLADDIVNLSGGGPGAPLSTLPLFAPPPEVEPSRQRHAVMLVGSLVLVGMSIVGIAAFAGARGESASPVVPTATPEARIASSAAREDTPAPIAPITSATAANTTAAPSSVATAVRTVVRASDTRSSAPHIASAAPSSTAITAPKCCAGETDTACQIRLAAGAPCAAPPFDRPSAARALRVDLAGCKRADGPTGAGHVKVTFQPSGSVSAVDVEAPYAGTATGACIAQGLRGVSVPAFAGGPLTVGKSFAIE